MRSEKNLANILRKVKKARTPFSVEWELTNRCNLDCLHCLRDTRIGNEVSTGEIKKILCQLRQENCLGLIFTGGEVFLRKDLFEILEFSKKLGFSISVFTNAILLNEKMIIKLKRLNLYAVQVSLYGATAEVHDSITKVRGSFKKTVNSIRLLKKHKVPFRIAAMSFNKNFHQLSLLRKMARINKWDINFDFIIFPTLKGGSKPLPLRATDEQVRTAFKNGLMSWKTNSNQKDTMVEEDIFHIGFRGWSTAHLSSTGKVFPSVVFRMEIGDLRKDTFHNIWHHSPRFRKLRSLKKEDFECFHCKWYNNCCWKVEMAFLEERSFLKPSREICRINAIYQQLKKEKLLRR